MAGDKLCPQGCRIKMKQGPKRKYIPITLEWSFCPVCGSRLETIKSEREEKKRKEEEQKIEWRLTKEGCERLLLSFVAFLGFSSVKVEIDEKDIEEMNAVLQTLPFREQEVLVKCFGMEEELPKTLKEVGQELGLSAERIRQLKRQAFRKLMHSVRMKRFNVLKKVLGE